MCGPDGWQALGTFCVRRALAGHWRCDIRAAAIGRCEWRSHADARYGRPVTATVVTAAAAASARWPGSRWARSASSTATSARARCTRPDGARSRPTGSRWCCRRWALNYYGQGALLIGSPDAIESPFYRLAPDWGVLPLVALATLATVIASQALISGVFSLTMQAIQLGYAPRMRVVHTSERAIGQIYIPAVNWGLMLACVALVVGFGSSTALAAAYGIAVTSTMVVTTLLFAVVAPRALQVDGAAGLGAGAGPRGHRPRPSGREPVQDPRRRVVPAVGRRRRSSPCSRRGRPAGGWWPSACPAGTSSCPPSSRASGSTHRRRSACRVRGVPALPAGPRAARYDRQRPAQRRPERRGGGAVGRDDPGSEGGARGPRRGARRGRRRAPDRRALRVRGDARRAHGAAGRRAAGVCDRSPRRGLHPGSRAFWPSPTGRAWRSASTCSPCSPATRPQRARTSASRPTGR